VIDEYGGRRRIDHDRDVLEQIVGDIDDEFDRDERATTSLRSLTDVIASRRSPKSASSTLRSPPPFGRGGQHNRRPDYRTTRTRSQAGDAVEFEDLRFEAAAAPTARRALLLQ